MLSELKFIFIRTPSQRYQISWELNFVMNFLIPRLVDPNINDKLYFDSGQNMELAIRDHQNIQSESHDMRVVSRWTNSWLFMIPDQRENEISQVYCGFFHYSVCAFHTGLLILFLARRSETKKRIKFKHNFKSLLLISTSKNTSGFSVIKFKDSL